MALKALEKLRKALKDCTNKAGVEPNQFDTYWITAIACDKLIDAVEAEIERDYMRLPVDADGMPIHVGDWLTDGADKFPVMAVTEYGFCRGSKIISGFYYWDNPQDFRHVKPRTLEDVLRDVWKEALDYAKSDIWRNPDEVFAERADEIRELMKDDVQ